MLKAYIIAFIGVILGLTPSFASESDLKDNEEAPPARSQASSSPENSDKNVKPVSRLELIIELKDALSTPKFYGEEWIAMLEKLDQKSTPALEKILTFTPDFISSGMFYSEVMTMVNFLSNCDPTKIKFLSEKKPAFIKNPKGEYRPDILRQLGDLSCDDFQKVITYSSHFHQSEMSHSTTEKLMSAILKIKSERLDKLFEDKSVFFQNQELHNWPNIIETLGELPNKKYQNVLLYMPKFIKPKMKPQPFKRLVDFLKDANLS